MTDKLRKTYPLRLSVAKGEQPSGAKLTAMSDQARNALTIVEKALGDLWGESGDSVLYQHPLQIVNLARATGKMEYLNPLLPTPVDTEFLYYEKVGYKYTGATQCRLLFSPSRNITDGSWAGSGGLDSSPETSLANVNTSGEWYVDVTTRTLYTHDPLTGNEVVQYKVQGGQEISPNIIPDPRQDTFTSCRISSSGGKFYLHLPPRQPLDLNFSEDIYPCSGEFTENIQTAEGSATIRLWGGTTEALDGQPYAEYYRYVLPEEIRDVWDTIGNGDQLPVGFIYLFDQEADKVITDALFFKTSTPWILEVESESFGSELQVRVDRVTDNEEEANYSDCALSLITVGGSVSKVLKDAIDNLLSHNHGGIETRSASIKHEYLVETNPLTSSDPDQGTYYPSDMPSWRESNYVGDAHTSLLSRVGSQATSDKYRDPLNNAMVGHLLLANQNSNDYLNGLAPDDSYGLYFGNLDGARLYAYPRSWGAPSLHTDSDFEVSGYVRTVSGIAIGNIDDTEQEIHILAEDDTGAWVRWTTHDGVDLDLGYTGVGVSGLQIWDDSDEVARFSSNEAHFAVPVRAETYEWGSGGTRREWMYVNPFQIFPESDNFTTNTSADGLGAYLDIGDGDSAVLPLRFPKNSTLVRIELALDVVVGGGIDIEIDLRTRVWNNSVDSRIGNLIQITSDPGGNTIFTIDLESSKLSVQEDRYYWLFIDMDGLSNASELRVYGIRCLMEYDPVVELPVL